MERYCNETETGLPITNKEKIIKNKEYGEISRGRKDTTVTCLMIDILEQSWNRRDEIFVSIFSDLGKDRDVSNIDINEWVRLPDVVNRDPKFITNRSN